MNTVSLLAQRSSLLPLSVFHLWAPRLARIKDGNLSSLQSPAGLRFCGAFACAVQHVRGVGQCYIAHSRRLVLLLLCVLVPHPLKSPAAIDSAIHHPISLPGYVAHI
jgi:hypothetical protein